MSELEKREWEKKRVFDLVRGRWISCRCQVWDLHWSLRYRVQEFLLRKWRDRERELPANQVDSNNIQSWRQAFVPSEAIVGWSCSEKSFAPIAFHGFWIFCWILFLTNFSSKQKIFPFIHAIGFNSHFWGGIIELWSNIPPAKGYFLFWMLLDFFLQKTKIIAGSYFWRKFWSGFSRILML